MWKYVIQQCVHPTDKITERVTENHHTRDNVHEAAKCILDRVYICRSCDLLLRDACDFVYDDFIDNDRYKKIPTHWLSF